MSPLSVIKDLAFMWKERAVYQSSIDILPTPLFRLQSFKPFCELRMCTIFLEYFFAWRPTVLAWPYTHHECICFAHLKRLVTQIAMFSIEIYMLCIYKSQK